MAILHPIFPSQAKNLRDLNSSCIVQMFKYTEDPVQHSYSPCENAHLLTVPVVAVTAADDPFCPIHGVYRVFKPL